LFYASPPPPPPTTTTIIIIIVVVVVMHFKCYSVKNYYWRRVALCIFIVRQRVALRIKKCNDAYRGMKRETTFCNYRKARFPFKRKRLRWQAANHGCQFCHCFDRAFLLAGKLARFSTSRVDG